MCACVRVGEFIYAKKIVIHENISVFSNFLTCNICIIHIRHLINIGEVLYI